MSLVALVVASVLGVLAGAGALVLVRWMRIWPLAAQRMARHLDQSTAAGQRRFVELEGTGPLRFLGRAMNAFIDAQERRFADLQADTERLRSRLGETSGQLVALVSELPHGVVLCGADHRIVLCNERAVQLLGASTGVGESIFAALGEEQVLLALDRIAHWHGGAGPVPPIQWVAQRPERLLRVLMSPMTDPNGSVLVLEDVTRSIEWNSGRERLLSELGEGMRGALGNIRAAVETVHRYPDMEPDRRVCFDEVIRTEVEHLSLWLHEATERADTSGATGWPLEDMPARELGDLVRHGIEHDLGLPIGRSHHGEAALAGVDGHGLCRAMAELAARLARHFALRSLMVETGSKGHSIQLGLVWSGEPLDRRIPGATSGLPVRKIADVDILHPRHKSFAACRRQPARRATGSRPRPTRWADLSAPSGASWGTTVIGHRARSIAIRVPPA